MRYIVTKPVPGGYAFYDVVDTESTRMPNMSVQSFPKRDPDAARKAEELRKSLCGR